MHKRATLDIATWKRLAAFAQSHAASGRGASARTTFLRAAKSRTSEMAVLATYSPTTISALPA